MKIIYIFDGLGNQMFQYAFYKKMKKLYKNVYGNLDTFSRDYPQGLEDFSGYELKKIFNIDIEEKKILFDTFFSRVRWKRTSIFLRAFHKLLRKLNVVIYLENWSECVEDKLNKKRIIFYTGWWQSEKFFKDISNEIRSDFSFPRIVDKKNLEVLKKIKTSNSVGIHVRRGDYLKDKGFKGLASLEYYQRAIEYIENKIEAPCFFIFSNDIEWCKENFKLENCHYIDWNKGEESYRDMQLMSLCKHNIIPNSTFSWWGAWLNNNPNKIVIAPEKWFNDCANMNYSDIVPENWIKIKNY